MPFLGKQPTAGFASIVKDDLTPDGSTTAFTLSKNVASANDIAVFVGNVRQEPTDAYSVSGTTLTMTAAPASGVNFYVLHIAGTVESSVVPADGTISSAKVDSSVPTIAGTNAFSGSNSFSERVNITGGPSTRYGVYDDALRVKGDSYSYLEVEGTNSQAGIILNKDGSTGFGVGISNQGKLKLKPIASIDQTGISNWKDQNTSGIQIDSDGYHDLPSAPSVGLYKNGNQALAQHTPTKITGFSVYGSTQYGSEWNSSTNRYTVSKAGRYIIGWMVQSNVQGGLHLRVDVNGSNGWCGDSYLDMGDGTGQAYTLLASLNANDYIEFYAYLTTAGNVNANRTRAWVQYIG